MGQTSSADNRTLNVNDTTSVSKDFVNILNKNMNSVTANTIISAEQNCINTNAILQKIDFSKFIDFGFGNDILTNGILEHIDLNLV